MRRILIFAPSYLRTRFFYRVKKALGENYQIEFATLRPSSTFFLRKKGEAIHHLPSLFPSGSAPLPPELEERKEEVIEMDQKIGLIPPSQLKRGYRLIGRALLHLLISRHWDYIFIFNGYGHFIEATARVVAQFTGVRLLFFEIGNFPNRIFVDTEGVNFASSLTHRDLGTCSNFSPVKFFQFKEKHLKQKETHHTPPQARVTLPRWVKFLDYSRLWDPPIGQVIGRKVEKLFKRRKIFPISSDLPKGDFLFFPLQLPFDSQILKFSAISFWEGIERGVTRGKELGLPVYFKPHPADPTFPRWGWRVVEMGGKLTTANSYQLLKRCQYVVTINSTMGLESFFYHKPLEVLGESWYKRYSSAPPPIKDKVLFNYLFNILVEGDYFDESSKIDGKKIEKMLK